MKKLANKIVLITGASAGIGKAVAEQFAAQGANLILTARRVERLTQLAEQLHKDHGVAILTLACDVQDRINVEKSIAELPVKWQAIDILINNAGLALGLDAIQAADPDNWDTMIDTNIKGLLYVTRAILPGMIERNSGHIINLGSTAGRNYYPGGNVYCATKHAVKAISKTLRIDLLGTAIRVSEIAPGAVNTEFSTVRFKGDTARADDVYKGFDALAADDIADSILYCATRPKHVNISVLEVYPTAQASANHLHRE